MNTTIENVASEISSLRTMLAKTNEMLAQVLRQQGQWLSTEQVLARLKISRSTLLAWRKAGNFPNPAKNGKYLLEEVIAWEASK